MSLDEEKGVSLKLSLLLDKVCVVAVKKFIDGGQAVTPIQLAEAFMSMACARIDQHGGAKLVLVSLLASVEKAIEQAHEQDCSKEASGLLDAFLSERKDGAITTH